MMLAAIALAATNAPCALPPGWERVAARHPRYIVFGETHGTEQSPRMVEAIACALARRHHRLLVAIEQQASDDAAFQAIWRTPDRDFTKRLRALPGWAGRVDGVASESMFALVVRLHHQAAAGRGIAVTLFNGNRDAAQAKRFADQQGQGPHEAAQAENVRDAAARGRYDVVLVLSGSLHARKRMIGEGATAFRPMAMQLAPQDRIVSLRMLTGAGTMWNCLMKPGLTITPGKSIPPEAIDCGNHLAKGFAELGAAPFVRMGDPPGAEAGGNYDGYIWLGPSNGSQPAVRDAAQQGGGS